MDFVKTRLSWGHALGRMILERGDFQNGSATTLLPIGTYAEVGSERLRAFDHSILIDQPPIQNLSNTGGSSTRLQAVPNLDILLERLCQEWLGERGDNVVAFAEPLLSAHEASHIESITTSFMTFNNEIYYLLDRDRDNLQAIEEVVRVSMALFRLGVFSSLPPGLTLPQPGQSCDESTIRVLAERVLKIVVGAYDGEGFVLWHAPPEKIR